jgi:sugar phosphate isomerase/epimerase
MTADWRKWFYLGNVYYASYPYAAKGEGAILEAVRSVVTDEFFDAIEITWVKDPETRRQVKELLQYSQMPVAFGGGPPYLTQKINLASLDEAERSWSIEKAKELIDEAYYFGAKQHFLLAGPDPGADSREKARSLLVGSLNTLCDYAAQKATDYQLTISIESIDRAVKWKGLLGPSADAVAVAKQVRERHPSFGLTIDLSHLAQLGESIEGAVAVTKGTMIHTHLANCVVKDTASPLYGDEHPLFGVPGGEWSVGDVTRYLQTLHDHDFFSGRYPYGKPLISLEVKPQPNDDPLVTLAAAKRAVLQAWSNVQIG